MNNLSNSQTIEQLSEINLHDLTASFGLNLQRFIENSFWKQLNLKLLDWLVYLLSNPLNISAELIDMLKGRRK